MGLDAHPARATHGAKQNAGHGPIFGARVACECNLNPTELSKTLRSRPSGTFPTHT